MEFRAGVESRRHARIAVDASVFVSYKGRLYSGRVAEMSTRALHVAMDANLPIGALTEVVLVGRGAKIMLMGTVARSSEHGLVIEESRGSSEKLRSFFFNMA